MAKLFQRKTLKESGRVPDGRPMLSSQLFMVLSGKLHSPFFRFQQMTWVYRSFFGYSNVNQVLSEMRDPIRTIKRAVPIAISAITVTYLLVNVAYFVVVDKNEILTSGQAVT